MRRAAFTLQEALELPFGDARQALREPRAAAPSPLHGAPGPQAERCACGAYACFGLGPPTIQHQQWFCAACKPADFYTRGRA